MKKIITTSKAPTPIGPYSQGVVLGNLLFTSGQIALDSLTGDLILVDIKSETHKVMSNLNALLEEAGTGFNNVVKTSIFLKSMEDFATVNEVYASYFSTTDFPARETVQVAKLPRDVNIEISMVVEIIEQ
jgi:2-iminobutanoate/2-iminopropanoate deaminase